MERKVRRNRMFILLYCISAVTSLQINRAAQSHSSNSSFKIIHIPLQVQNVTFWCYNWLRRTIFPLHALQHILECKTVFFWNSSIFRSAVSPWWIAAYSWLFWFWLFLNCRAHCLFITATMNPHFMQSINRMLADIKCQIYNLMTYVSFVHENSRWHWL